MSGSPLIQQVIGGYLNAGQHNSDQVVVGEQQGTNNAAVTYVLDDGWEEETEACETGSIIC